MKRIYKLCIAAWILAIPTWLLLGGSSGELTWLIVFGIVFASAIGMEYMIFKWPNELGVEGCNGWYITALITYWCGVVALWFFDLSNMYFLWIQRGLIGLAMEAVLAVLLSIVGGWVTVFLTDLLNLEKREEVAKLIGGQANQWSPDLVRGVWNFNSPTVTNLRIPAGVGWEAPGGLPEAGGTIVKASSLTLYPNQHHELEEFKLEIPFFSRLHHHFVKGVGYFLVFALVWFFLRWITITILP